MHPSYQSFLIGTTGLLVALLFAVAISYLRITPSKTTFRSLKPVLVAAIGFHLVHLAEETAYDFHIRYPELLGLEPWPIQLFLGFNIAWVLIWTAGIFLVPVNRFTIATFWFLAVASVINAFAHPAFSVLVGGYFPGLVSSPFVGALGVLLGRQLLKASKAPGNS